MAKRTNKSETINADDRQKLLAIKAMDRASARLSGELSKKSLRLEPGSYALDVSVEISGDVLVAADVDVDGREGPIDKPGELLEALLATVSDSEAELMLGRAVDVLKRAETTGVGKDELKVGEDRLARVFEPMAKRRKRWKQSPATTRAGAVTGAPAVRVSGSVDGNRVSVEISGE